MFSFLTDKLNSVFAKLQREKKLTEDNITDAVNDVRLALLEADCNYSVVKNFVKRVKEKAVGEALIKSVQPGQQFAEIIHKELVSFMGSEEVGLVFKKRPANLMLVGLQGAGKTTHAVKLANYEKKNGRFLKPCVVACDLQRPAAIQQLKTLAEQANIAFFSYPGAKDPREVVKAALKESTSQGWDFVIFDTAGRLHVDDDLMRELSDIKKMIEPDEVLFVANAAIGQDAVKSATQFHEKIGITGTILTMLDGTARAGCAISIREATGSSIKFEGVGEKIQDIVPFNPESMADRILGMGDTINLVRMAKEHIKEDEAMEMGKKIKNSTFSFSDYAKQMRMIKKMGSLKGLLSMLPGMSQFKNLDVDERQFSYLENMINSMTPDEREERCELVISRRKRIAKGSGIPLEEVNKQLKNFSLVKGMFKDKKSLEMLQKMMGG